MKRSRPRWSRERLRRYETVKNEAKVYEGFYQQSPFWQMIAGILEAEDKADTSTANDNQPTLAVDGGK